MKNLLLALLLAFTTTTLNATEIIDVPIENKITGLYIAFFNRAADQSGMGYWVSQAQKAQTEGNSVLGVMLTLSSKFAVVPTFALKYADKNNREFVEAIYQNALGKAGNVGGINYWAGRLDNKMSRSDMVATFINTSLTKPANKENYPRLSDEELEAAQKRQAFIGNKITVALAFTHQMKELSNVADPHDYYDDPSYLASIKIISEVTEDEGTVSIVLGFLERIVGSEDPIGDILRGSFANAPIILSLTTEMSGTILENVLSANKEAKLRLIGLEDDSVKVEVTTSRGQQAILPSSLSIEEQSITFIAPVSVTEGKLSITDATGNALASITYTIITSQTPYLKEVVPDIVNAGESVTLTGVNLPSAPVEVVFEDQNSSFTQTVTPSGNSISFTVPLDAASGSIYLQINQLETNRLQLSIKKEIEALVVLGEGVDINVSDISFVMGLEAFTPNENNRTRLSVENKDLDYINAIVERPDKEPALLYTAVILPNMNGTIEINAHSTAIAWVMMGMGASIATSPEQWQSLYEHIASDIKVQEFADYIDTLQGSDFDAWAALSDETLKEKFQDALISVVQTQIQTRSIAARSMARELDGGSTIIIRQTPDNSGIYVDDYKYFSEINTGYRLNNGNVNVINDTRLYLSVEVLDNEGDVVNGYSHYDATGEINKKSFIVPQGWAIINLSSLKELSLGGTDSIIEIIIGANSGETYEEKLADDLMTRVWINGVGVPMFNQALGFLINKKLDKRYGKDPSHMKRLISGLSMIYDGNFISDLGYELKRGTSYSSIAMKILIDPLYNGLSKCAAGGLNDSFCVQTLTGIAQVLGMGNTDDILVALMSRMAVAIENKVIKGGIVTIPVVGQIAGIAFVAYESLGVAANVSTIAGSFIDMSHYPREINVEVDFPLEVSNAKPTCLAIENSDTDTNILIYGKGFKGNDDTLPGIMLGINSEGNGIYETKQDPYVNVAGDKMTATFDSQELVGAGSWSNYLYVSMYGANVKYQKEMMRIVSPNDEVVYFDSIEPQSAYRGATVTLKGCGWVPLDDIKVYFNEQDSQDYVEAEVLSSTIEAIRVKVPDTARSGAVYVTAGNKETKKLLFDINPFSLNEEDEEYTMLEGDTVWLTGKALTLASKIYLTDHTGKTIEGAIIDNDESSLKVVIPDGLAYGPIHIYAEGEDGTVTNEIVIALVPKGVDANPPSHSFADTIQVTLSQEDNVDIFYRIDEGEEQEYTGPITLNADEAQFEYYSIYAYARVVVDDINYTSNELEYQYRPVSDGADAGGPYEIGICAAMELDGSGSFDPDGTIVTYAWSASDGTPLGGGQTLPLPVLGRTPGDHIITLTVTNDKGATYTDTTTVTINGADGDYDFSYIIKDPSLPAAQTYIVSHPNAVIQHEEDPISGASGVYWKSDIGGATEDNTTSGNINFQFTFSGAIEIAFLYTRIDSFHWSYSKGHTFLEGSANGADWEQLAEAPPPESGGVNGANYNDFVPNSMIGETDIWVKAVLYSYGDKAPEGGIWTNTAQFLRYGDNGNDNTTFKLNVCYEGD